MPDIPSRITQAWIEKTVPVLSEEEFQHLLAVMRERNWTDADLASRVFPYRQGAAVPPVPERARDDPAQRVTPEPTGCRVAIPCPRGHLTIFVVPEQGIETELCCGKCSTKFIAAANVLCRGLSRERISRTSAYYGFVVSSWTTLVSTIVRMRYRTPSPPPLERSCDFITRGTAQEIQVRSGERISITFMKPPARRRLRVAIVTSHTLDRSWKIRSEGLREKAFDHLGIPF